MLSGFPDGLFGDDGVPHGNVPAIGYELDLRDASIALSSDQNGSAPGFAEFARGEGLLCVDGGA